MPASANVFNLATFDPKVVATTSFSALSISSCMDELIDASDRPFCFEKTLVLSQISAFTPPLAISNQTSLLNGSPTPGVSSILKSPVCTSRPTGVSITTLLLSGIECEMGTNPTLNGPKLNVLGHCSTVLTELSEE